LNLAIDLSLGQYQLYGLIFLIGSFSVATLSDLRRMSAQVEFTEVWTIFILIFFVVDLVLWKNSNHIDVFLKWMLILVFLLISDMRIGFLFKMAKGDLLACASVLILLPFFLGILFLILLKLFDLMMRPILRHAGAKGAYPFMPVVFITTFLLFLSEWFILGKFTLVFTLPF